MAHGLPRGATTDVLARAIARHVYRAGDHETALPALSLHRRYAPTEPVPCIPPSAWGSRLRATSKSWLAIGSSTKNPADASKTFDLLGSQDKELFWIEYTTRRFKDSSQRFPRGRCAGCHRQPALPRKPDRP
jgi:hypothetical protein